jgi:hypothetical protein
MLMRTHPRLLAAIIAACSVLVASGTSYPPRVELRDLLKTSDVVALVWITAGDAQVCPRGIYRAEVIAPVKGTRVGETLYFNNGNSYLVGGKCVLFLDRTGERVDACPKGTSGLPWGVSDPAVVLFDHAPFSPAFPIENTCSIPGCEDGVHVSGWQVSIPPELAVSPDICNPKYSQDLWVRTAEFIETLKRWAAQK